MLDIILNSKLRAAVDAGIQIEFTQIQALEKLPLSDAEPCSLIMNIIDNAVNAATLDWIKEYGNNFYKVTMLLPLRQQLR